MDDDVVYVADIRLEHISLIVGGFVVAILISLLILLMEIIQFKKQKTIVTVI